MYLYARRRTCKNLHAQFFFFSVRITHRKFSSAEFLFYYYYCVLLCDVYFMLFVRKFFLFLFFHLINYLCIEFYYYYFYYMCVTCFSILEKSTCVCSYVNRFCYFFCRNRITIHTGMRKFFFLLTFISCEIKKKMIENFSEKISIISTNP